MSATCSLRFGRLAAVGLTLAFAMPAGPTKACAPYMYLMATAKARIRDAKGHWRAASIETNGGDIRIEYAAPTTPWGRIVLVSDVDDGPAYVFPLSVSGPIPRANRVTWKTSLSQAMPLVRLSTTFLGQWPSSGPAQRFHGLPCQAPLDGDAATKASMCVHETGIPLYVRDSGGRNVFEVLSLIERSVPAARFKPPRDLPISDRKPAYLEKLTCSGWSVR